MNYQELIQSNWGFISEISQDKVRRSRIFLAGCGLGSNIALLAARTGFTHFILADGDTVKLGNLNRQAFRSEQIGKNKAEATAGLIREINPDASIEVFSQYITTIDEVERLVACADLVVNMVDPGAVIFQINRSAIKRQKPVLFPLNIGYGGATFVFTHDSASLEQMVDPQAKPDEFFLDLVIGMESFLPDYLKTHLFIKDKVTQNGFSLPQLGIAANITSALIVATMVKLILNIPVNTAPRPLTLDSWQASENYSIKGEPGA